MRKTIRCPKCTSKSVEMYAGFVTGNYWCRKCGYLGPVIEVVYKKSKSRRYKNLRHNI